MHSNILIFNILTIVFLITLLTQFVYYIQYFLPLSKYKPKKGNLLHPKVTILICVHNEEQNLKENLPFIISQKYPNFEIIIVDDRSKDNSLKIVTSFANDNLELIKISQIEEGLSPKKNAITKGFEKATGEFILLTDADCKPASVDWVSKMVECINENTDVVLGYSPYEKKNGLLNKLIQFDTFFTAIQYMSFANKREAYMGVGRNLLIKKKAFLNVDGFKGFENILAGDDDIIVQKITKEDNVEICLDKDSFVNSKPETTWWNWFSQKRRHLSVGVNYKNTSKRKVALFQQSFIWMYLSFFLLLVSQSRCFEWITMVIILLLIRSLLINIGLAKKLNIKISLYILTSLEILYFFAYLLIGISVLIKNKRKWR